MHPTIQAAIDALRSPAPIDAVKCRGCGHQYDAGAVGFPDGRQIALCDCPNCGERRTFHHVGDRWLCRACDGICWESEQEALACEACEAERDRIARELEKLQVVPDGFEIIGLLHVASGLCVAHAAIRLNGDEGIEERWWVHDGGWLRIDGPYDEMGASIAAAEEASRE